MKTKKLLLTLGLLTASVSASAFTDYNLEFRVHNNSVYRWYLKITDNKNIARIVKKHSVAPNGKHTEPKLFMGSSTKSYVDISYEAKENGKVIARCNFSVHVDGDNITQTKETGGINDKDCGFARTPYVDYGNPFTVTTIEIHPILNYKKKAA